MKTTLDRPYSPCSEGYSRVRPATRQISRWIKAERISATGRAVLVDLHSYPLYALPYERHQDAKRPPVCLGVDVDRTPAALQERVSRACSLIGQVVVNEPSPAATYRCVIMAVTTG
jgi:hypothetical protein